VILKKVIILAEPTFNIPRINIYLTTAKP